MGGQSDPGVFITLEGPDGAGKSSQAALLAAHIRSVGREVVLTREPGGTPLGEQIRRVLLEATVGSHDALSDALLFNAARSRLVSEVVRPALGRLAVVVSDRYGDSTLAYQGYGGGVPLNALRGLAEVATGGLKPDRTVLIDLPAAAGLVRRLSGEAADLTRFELDSAHDAAFHERVRNGYLEMAATESVRWRVIDGSAAPETVAEAVWAAVADLFEGF